MNRTATRIGAVALLLCLGACAAGSGEAQVTASSGLIGQFVLGLWHGFIAPLTLIVEVINYFAPHVLPWHPKMFESSAGIPYDVGFYLTVSGGPHLFWAHRRRRV